MEARYYPAYDSHGIANEMACCDCNKAGFGIPSIVTLDAYFDGDEFCIDCAAARGIEVGNAEQFLLDYPVG